MPENWNSIYTSGSIKLTMSPQKESARDVPSRELLETTAVRTLDGWRGQIIVDGEIVYETQSETMEDALAAVNTHVVARVKWLLGGAE